MKKIHLYIAICLMLIGCGDDDTARNGNEFLNQITGVYYLTEVQSDVAVDLNLDGVPQTDLLTEIDCFSGYPPEAFRGDIIFKPESGGYKSLNFRIIEHSRFLGDIPEDTCFNEVSLVYEYTVNEETKEVIITWRDGEREAEYGTLVDVKWMDNKVHYTVNKRYYTSEGWQNVNIHLTYDKFIENK